MSWDPNPAQRKLLFVGIVIALAAVGVYLTAPSLFGERDTEGSSSAPRETRAPEVVRAGESTEASPDTASPISTPSIQPSVPAEEAPYAKTVLSFARAFTKTDRSADAWHQAVARHTTSALAEALAYTRPESVPAGTPTGQLTLLQIGDNTVHVAVHLDNGRRILVTVTSVGSAGQAYEVSDVRPGDEA